MFLNCFLNEKYQFLIMLAVWYIFFQTFVYAFKALSLSLPLSNCRHPSCRHTWGYTMHTHYNLVFQLIVYHRHLSISVHVDLPHSFTLTFFWSYKMPNFFQKGCIDFSPLQQCCFPLGSPIPQIFMLKNFAKLKGKKLCFYLI